VQVLGTSVRVVAAVPVPPPPELFLWNLLIDERHHGRGYDAAMVRHITELMPAECATELLTSHGHLAAPAGLAGTNSPDPPVLKYGHG
jgi:hypothetical protein